MFSYFKAWLLYSKINLRLIYTSKYEGVPRQFRFCNSSLFILRWFTLCCFVVYLFLCYFVLVLFSSFSIAVTSLVEEKANLSAFRTFVRFALVWFCLLPLPLGVWEGLRFVIVTLPGLLSYLFFQVWRLCYHYLFIIIIISPSVDLEKAALRNFGLCYVYLLLFLCKYLIPGSIRLLQYLSVAVVVLFVK